MQSIFNISADSKRGVRVPPVWNQTKAGLKRNLAQVVEYYQDRSIGVRNNHFLVRLLNSLRLSFEADVERFYDQIDVVSAYTSMNFLMTNPIFKGKVFDGIFYGTDTREILISHADVFDVFDCEKNWKQASPVRILDHCKSDIQMHIPNGVPYSDEVGLAVIAINIPMLAVMWRSFLLLEAQVQENGGAPRTTAQFIHTYVLPNALASHLDIALLNRLTNRITGKTPPVMYRRHATTLSNYEAQVDKTLDEVGKLLVTTDMEFHDMLCQVPTVSALNMADALRLPNNAPTRQYAWAEIVARIKAVSLMAAYSPTQLSRYNKPTLQLIERTVAYTSMKSIISQQLPNDSQSIFLMLDGLSKAAHAS